MTRLPRRGDVTSRPRRGRLATQALLPASDAVGAGTGAPAAFAAGAAVVAAAFGLGALVGARANVAPPRDAGSGLGARLGLGLGGGSRRQEMDRTVDLLDYFLKNPGPAITLATLVFGMTFAKIGELEKSLALNRLEVEKNVSLTSEQLRNTVAVNRQELEKTVAINRQELEKIVALGQQETRYAVNQLSAKVDKLAENIRELRRPAS